MTDVSIELLSTESRAWLPLMGICGLLLLAAGGLIVRLGAVMAGLALGGMAGWLIWSELQLTVPSWLIMSGSCIICIVLALLLTRLFIAVLLGLILSLWMTSLCMVFLQFDGDPQDSMKPLPTIIGTMFAVKADDRDIDRSRDESQHPGLELSANFHGMLDEARSSWESQTQTWKLVLLSSLTGGFIIGLLSTVVLPRRSVMYMSCFWGSLLLLAALIGLFSQASTGQGPWDSWMAMILAWTAISATGLAVQSILDRGPVSEHGN